MAVSNASGPPDLRNMGPYKFDGCKGRYVRWNPGRRDIPIATTPYPFLGTEAHYREMLIGVFNGEIANRNHKVMREIEACVAF